MITREEFLHLYQKCASGQCSDAEKERLADYTDDLKLADNVWDDPLHSEDEVYHQIWDKLQKSRYPSAVKKNNNYLWLKIAATLILASAAVWIFTVPRKTINRVAQTKTTPAPLQIKPGGNKAILTLSDGTSIALNDTKNGMLTTQSGTQVTKAREGMLVYQPRHKTSADHPAINSVATPRGGQYHLVLSDGTRVWLNAASELKFPAQFSGNERRVELKGEAYFEVHRNLSVPFIVHTSGQEVKVLGTHFNIKAYSDEASVKTSLLQGRVNVTSGSKTSTLNPGFEAISNQGDIKVRPADVQQSIAWKNGWFQFNNATIEEVMKQVSRWYDADIVISKAPLPLRQFTGTISRQVPISEMLEMLRYTGIKFSIRDRKILVHQ